MKESTQVKHLGPSQAGLCKPPDQNRGQGAGSYEAKVDCRSQVVIIAELHSAEENCVAYNPKESESLKQLHQQHTDDNLELLAGLPWWWRSTVRTGGLGESTRLASALWQSLEVSCHHTTWPASWLLGCWVGWMQSVLDHAEL